MRSRLIIIIVAIAFGVVAAVIAIQYLQGQQARITEGTQLVTVLVAAQDLSVGMTSEEVLSKGYITQRQIPRQYVAGSAVSSRAALEGKVVSQPVSKDEQVTGAMFKYAADVGLASSTPRGYLAVSIPYDAARGVGGLLRPGDTVAVFGTFAQDASGKGGISKLILSKVKVLAVGAELTAASTAQAGTANSSGGLSSVGQTVQSASTITLALTAADAEKLVFTEEQGRVWLGLFSPTDPNTPVTPGAGLSQVLR
jgi:pilus assembly protein CpaB